MGKDMKQLLLILAVGLGAPLLFFQDRFMNLFQPHDAEHFPPMGESVTAGTTTSAKQAAYPVRTADASDWYSIDSLTGKCVHTEGPVKLLQNLQTLNEPYTTRDTYAGGTVAEVTIEIPNRLSQVTYYRGRETCESAVAGKGAERRAELDKYR